MGAAPKLAGRSRGGPACSARCWSRLLQDVPEQDDLASASPRNSRRRRSYEDALDRARIFGQEQKFLIGVRLMTGALSARQAGAPMRDLAEALIRVCWSGSRRNSPNRMARQGGEAAVVAMGKLGGREMTAASDLDLMLLYDADPIQPRPGRRAAASARRNITRD